MTRAHVTLALLCSAALATSGCNLATADVEIPRTCITQRNVAVAGAVGNVLPPVPYTFDVGNDVPLLQTNGNETNLVVEDVHITPAAGSNPDLTGVTTAEIQAGPQDQAIASYTKSGNTVTELVLNGSSVNVAPFFANGQIQLQFVLAGNPPTLGWTADITTCAHGTSHVSY